MTVPIHVQRLLERADFQHVSSECHENWTYTVCACSVRQTDLLIKSPRVETRLKERDTAYCMSKSVHGIEGEEKDEGVAL